jgi:hypothetical protein
MPNFFSSAGSGCVSKKTLGLRRVIGRDYAKVLLDSCDPIGELDHVLGETRNALSKCSDACTEGCHPFT